MPHLLQSVRQNVAQEVFVLLERACIPHAADLPQRGVVGRMLPPGFPVFALAGLLCIAAAGVHERLRERSFFESRQRTNLSARKIAYASWNRTSIP
jgi:hypothetical protein